MGQSNGGLAVVTMQQSPHTNTSVVPGNLNMKDLKSNDRVSVLPTLSFLTSVGIRFQKLELIKTRVSKYRRALISF